MEGNLKWKRGKNMSIHENIMTSYLLILFLLIPTMLLFALITLFCPEIVKENAEILKYPLGILIGYFVITIIIIFFVPE